MSVAMSVSSVTLCSGWQCGTSAEFMQEEGR